jgi:hypothetical protein
MAVATGTTMVLAATVHRGSPWAGLNAMTNALGFDHRRPKARFDGARSLLGVGILVGGLVGFAALYEAALARLPWRRGIVSGALAGLGGFAVDRWLLPDALVPSFERTLGRGGTTAKYVALGLAAS